MRKTHPRKSSRHYEIIFRSTAKQEVISVVRTKLLGLLASLHGLSERHLARSHDRSMDESISDRNLLFNFDRDSESDKLVLSRAFSFFPLFLSFFSAKFLFKLCYILRPFYLYKSLISIVQLLCSTIIFPLFCFSLFLSFFFF